MLKICMIEACPDDDVGSIGAFYIRHHAELAGYKIDVLRRPKNGYDIELISCHHCSDFRRLAQMKKKAKFRIVGGHPMQNNPRPIIPFSDAVFIGEGESHIGNILRLIDINKNIECLIGYPGIIVSKYWTPGDILPKTQIENPLPNNPPYLNRPGTRSAAWYLELARGCPFKCNYCELGHSTKYRSYDKSLMKTKIDSMDSNLTKKINFYAPDEASYKDYNELYDYLDHKGYLSAFSSMRLESVMKHKPKVKKNMLIRIGIDGLTEETRKRANKPITNQMIIDYFKYWIAQGHINFKMFMIIGYEWETVDDFDEFETLMKTLFFLPMKKNIMLRIKWTPFIPQPCTPFKNIKPKYDYDLIKKINIFHGEFKRPRNEPGFWIENDGLMTEKSHLDQIKLTNGDEFLLLNESGTFPIIEWNGV